MYTPEDVEAGYCNRKILLPTRGTVTIASRHNATSNPDLCEMVEAVGHSILAILNNRPIPRRAAFPEGSLAGLNTCGLLSAEHVSAVLRTNPNPESTEDGWGCLWDFDSKSVSVWFDRERPPVTRDQPRRFQVGSHMVYLSEERTEDAQSCQALVDHRQLTGANQQWYLETVTVAVQRHKLSKAEGDLCVEATRLAHVVVARLPSG